MRVIQTDCFVSGQIFEFGQACISRYALSGALVQGSGIYQVGPYLHVGAGFGITISDSGINAKTSDLDTRYALSGLIQYALPVQALQFSPNDNQTLYFGSSPRVPSTTAATAKIFIRRTGVIKVAEFYWYSGGNAGSNEAISVYLRKNNATDFLIGTVAAATAERIFSNPAININMVSGDYFEIKAVCPAWGTNPTNVTIGGYCLVIE